MKRLIFIAMLHFLIFSNSGFAQEISSTKTLKMKQLISQLDTAKFKNNILYDIVYPLADLKHFNQQNRKDTSNFAHFSQAIFELKLASRNSFKISNEILDGIKYAYEKQNKCPIAIINLDFTTIKDNAFDENDPKMQIDSTNNFKRLIELPNKNPYENKHTIVISPLIEKLANTNQPLNFVFDKLFFDLSENAIQNLNITFDNNEAFSIVNNGNLINSQVSHQFSGSGKKLLKFIGNFQNGQQFETYATFELENINLNRNPQFYDKSIVKQIRSDEIFQPYEPEPDAPYTHTINRDDRAAMNFQIFYGKDKQKLTKPIIVIDGIDYDYDYYWNFSGYNHDIEQVKWRFDNPSNNHFGQKLRDSLYDIVIGDFPDYSIGDLVYVSHMSFTTSDVQLDTIHGGKIRKGGADYIQRNAKVLKKLIQAVNDSLVANNSNEKSILIGPSMGGLVSKWALKEMENDSIDHNVKLWVSFDAPHQGANIPVGFQAFVEHLGMYGHNLNTINGMHNISYLLNRIGGMDALNRVASKQMLVKHIFNEHYTSGIPFEIVSGGAPNYRNRFKNETNILGYPKILRKIAIINGSFFGETYGNGADEFLHTHFWLDSAPWGDIVNGHLNFDSNNGFSSTFNFDYGNLVPINDTYKVTASDAQYGSYDASSGSFGYDIPDFSSDFDNIQYTFLQINLPWIPTINLNAYIDGYIHQYKHKFSFMPTKSSLDFKGNNKRLTESLCHYGNLVTQNLTPFDCYYAPLHNEEHVILNNDNMAWLLQEIYGNYHNEPFPDSSLCSTPISLTGHQHLCPGVNETYQVNTNQNVNWILNGLTEINRTNNSITVTKDISVGLASITAIVNNTSLSKNVFCLPIIDPIHHGDNTIQLSSGDEDIPLDQQGITDVTWELTHGNGNIDYADDRTADINSNDYYGIVTVTNESGSVSKPFFGPNPDKCYIIKKMGADKYQVIDRCNGYTPLSTMPIKEIYDQYGTKIADAPVINDKIDVSNSGDSGDVRIIRVVVNGENVSKTIIKD